MAYTPIVLVPGFWLGAWAWDDVVSFLRADGHDVTPLTLPGLESADADRSMITLSDHVDAVSEAVAAAPRPVVLAVHSGAGFFRLRRERPCSRPDRGDGVLRRHGSREGRRGRKLRDAVELPQPSPEQLEQEENLDGLSKEQLETFRERAVPEPGGVLREAHTFTNERRLDVPSTVICTAFSSEQYKEAAKKGYPFLVGLSELRNVTFVDLPTSHWPMWSRPKELAEIIGDVARRAG